MTAADLRILLQEGEGTTVEFKENLSASFARAVVAMANTMGGRILIGVRDDGSVARMKDSNTLRARIQDIARNCNPPVKALVESIDGVLAVHVRESERKPVQCSDGFFWRQGSATQKLSRDELRDFFRAEGSVRFDLALCPRFRYPQDFDRGKFNAWLKLSTITGRPRTEDVLVNIGAAERARGKLRFRNAGVLFFAKDIRHFFPQAYLTCLLAKGVDKVDILDRKDFDGGVVADIEDTLRFIERNTRLAYRIKRLQRENIHEYPITALREAITNAVTHRDWFMEGANIFVEIYTDRIEVVSPGGFPKGITLAELGRKSVRRNALVADLLHRIDFIEKAGTGVKRIRDESRQGGYPEPVWAAGGFVTATFRPNPDVRAAATARDGRADVPAHEKAHEAQSGAQSGAQSRAQSGAQSRQVLAALSNVERSARQVAHAIGLRSKTGALKRTLTDLVARGLVEYTSPDKPGTRLQRYRLTDAGRAYLEQHKEPR